MDKVIFDGVEYTKASVAAKELRYTSDYLGQLCRAKKIDARLVGRTWFVNLDSVHTHKESKYQPQVVKTSVEISVNKPEISIETKSSRVEIKSVEQRRVARPAVVNRNIIGSKNSRNLKVSYEIDDGYLIPKITKIKVRPPRSIIVEQAGASMVKISNGREHQVSFQATALPEVALSGKLNVTTYPEATSEVSRETENNDISDERVDKNNTEVKSVVGRPLVKVLKMPVLARPAVFTSIKANQSKVALNAHLESNSKAIAHGDKNTTGLKFSPKLPNSTKEVSHQSQSKLLILSPAIAILLAIVCVGFIFSASSSVVVSGTDFFDSHVVLQLANLLEVFNK